MLSSSQQPTIEQKDPEEDEEEVKVEDLNDEENVEDEDEFIAETQLMKNSVLSDKSTENVQIRNSLIASSRSNSKIVEPPRREKRQSHY